MRLEQPQAIRTIFFDAGQTLLQPYPSVVEICQQVCQRTGLGVDLTRLKQGLIEAEDFFYRQVRLNRHTWASEQAINELWLGYYVSMLRHAVDERSEQRLYELARAITEEFATHTSWEVFPDVVPTLEVLQQHHYTLGVISDWGISLSSILHRHRLTRFFDCVIVSAIARYAKPSTLLYETALQRANAIADYTLHIGDSYIHDVLGARSAGITPVLLDRSHHLRNHDVDCILVHSLTELLTLLELPGYAKPGQSDEEATLALYAAAKDQEGAQQQPGTPSRQG
ncbi:MAG: HAD hydrolase-like protein [Thermogemmatispora sp.]|uniref:HAD family hydrolase n=1 Tax=Thermogemmatispora sp. TaxID=1968838 RepID=UPI002610869A|nr:HAD hydrolase-like protein [Thermogemmatispora sp.]MBX5459094.1 HAD hydrolase-like protein [Thermogemmatispora sp.]